MIPSSDVQHFVLWLSTFWAALYALRRFRKKHARTSFLPAPTASSAPVSPELFRTRDTLLTLRNCHLNIQSTAWNTLHQYAAARLKKRNKLRSLLAFAYDVGSLLGVVGMLGSIVLLTWTSIRLGTSWYESSAYTSNTHYAENHLRKRDMSSPPSSVPAESHSVPLQLIIPGVTTPLHHLPILLAALLTSQIIHEVGHAVAAALDGVALSSAGMGLTVILPSAFVAFPTGETESLPPRPRMRIITAGAFHNLVFWLYLSALAWTRVSTFIWPLFGYRDVSAYGRVVVHVDEESALYGYLPVGAVVHKIGDIDLVGAEGASEKWESLLSSDYAPPATNHGWCTETAWFEAHDASCCASTTTVATSSHSCFVPLEDTSLERCVDPLVFLDSEGLSKRRCDSATDCGHGQMCVRPRADQELVSLTVHLPSWLRSGNADAERTVVWQGDRSEILQEVEVGDWWPSYSFLPMHLPVVWSTWFSYLEMLTLSLYFFNLLPLPFLDGGQLLDTLFDMWTRTSGERSDSIALAELEGGVEHSMDTESGGINTKAARWKKTVHSIVGVLLGLCIVLSAGNIFS